MRRAYRLLRSRKLALYLIVAFVIYAAIATIVQDTDFSAPYKTPLFIGMTVLLAASTGVCAWDRTRLALRMRSVVATSAMIERLRASPDVVVEVGPAVSDDPLLFAQNALRVIGLRAERRGRVLEARGGHVGALGSALFHWSLALLFVFVGLGQLTRTHGDMDIVAGAEKSNRPESYFGVLHGPLAGSMRQLTIAVPRIKSNLIVDGMDHEVTPYLEIRSEAGRLLASGFAYPNHPVRYRSMLLHGTSDGYAAVVKLFGPSGSSRGEVLLRYSADGKRLEPGSFNITAPDGTTTATVTLAQVKSDSSGPRVRVTVASARASNPASPVVDMVLHEGGDVQLVDGYALRVLDLTRFARIYIVDDWSVYFIYALFLLAVIGLVLALFMPVRGVRVLWVENEGAARLHIAIRHGRGDSSFPGRVEAVLGNKSAEEDA